MAKTIRKVITVRGSSTFPVDMLRYDCCWPYTESDSYKTGLPFMDDEAHKMREVKLLSDSHHAPTIGRWKSFGWEVLTCETYR